MPRPDANDASPPIAGLIGSGPAMREVYRLTRQVARSNASVLLLGETGTGKELIAKAVHDLSPRSGGPFVRVNCGALSESLLESELFGHVRGSFTGAVGNRTGRFEAAHTGTIFLDEINSTTPKLQVKLLRVLQEREFERVGDTQTLRVDTRVIAASNRDLLEEVEAERFREDLYYRLNVVPIRLPPLRERREDIMALVTHFLRIYSDLNERFVVHVDSQAAEALTDYHWPGNVRELQNYIERAVVLADSDELTVQLLPPTVATPSAQPRARRGQPADLETLTGEVIQAGLSQSGPHEDNLYNKIVNRVERELIAQVMASCDNVQTKAATRLGINRNTLHKKLKEYGLEGRNTMIRPQDFEVEIGRSPQGIVVRVRHKPTGEQRIVDPVNEAAVGVTRDRLIQELCRTFYCEEEFRIDIGRSTGGDFIRVIHLPSGVQRSAMRREGANVNDLINDVLDELYLRNPTATLRGS